MLFPFSPPRAASFHMGSVGFPIDLIFCDGDGRIGRIVHAAQPGSSSRWTHPCASAVVEVAGGFCARAGVTVGLEVAAAPYVDPPPGLGPSESGVPEGDRYEDRRLPDEQPDAHDQPMSGWREQFGYQPSDGLEGLVGPNVRQSQWALQPGLEPTPARVPQNPHDPVARVVRSLQWAPDVLNAGASENAILDGAAVAASGMTAEQLSDALVRGGHADVGRVKGDYLVLFRGRQAWTSFKR